MGGEITTGIIYLKRSKFMKRKINITKKDRIELARATKLFHKQNLLSVTSRGNQPRFLEVRYGYWGPSFDIVGEGLEVTG